MVKKLLVSFCVVLFLASCANIKQDAVSFFLKPNEPFNLASAPDMPDYSKPESWAALPSTKDFADVLPLGDFTDGQANAEADVFYLHPTTFVSKIGWNQPLTHENSNLITDYWVMRNQASVFNGCCRVFAPRYRQAMLLSFFTEEDDGRQALDLAYSDLKRSFEYYLEHHNNGRPIIIATHSQGSYHGIRLLEEMFFNKPLKEQLVAAYLIGAAIPENRFMVDNGVPLCTSPEQTGCALVWNAAGPESNKERFKIVSRRRFPDTYQDDPEAKVACVNPLTWRHNEKLAHQKLNLGAVHYSGEFTSTIEGAGYRYEEVSPSPQVGLFDAKCENGVLVVSAAMESPYTEQPFGKQNYHLYDYDFFHMNIRENAANRISHFMPGTTEHKAMVSK